MFYGGGGSNDWQGWYSQNDLRKKHTYFGPVPEGGEFLLVGSFLIRKQDFVPPDLELYAFKPFEFLTKKEKAIALIVKG